MQCYRVSCRSHCLMNKLHRLVYLTMTVLHIWVSKKMNLVSATQFFFNLPNTKKIAHLSTLHLSCTDAIYTFSHIILFALFNENAILMWNKRYQKWQMKIIVMWSIIKGAKTKHKLYHWNVMKMLSSCEKCISKQHHCKSKT